MTKAHWVSLFLVITYFYKIQEENNKGEPNQLYFIGNLITRLYLTRTLLSPDLSIPQIMQEFKHSIFKGQKFYFSEFLSLGNP